MFIDEKEWKKRYIWVICATITIYRAHKRQDTMAGARALELRPQEGEKKTKAKNTRRGLAKTLDVHRAHMRLDQKTLLFR
jgi:hypothetical protein